MYLPRKKTGFPVGIWSRGRYQKENRKNLFRSPLKKTPTFQHPFRGPYLTYILKGRSRKIGRKDHDSLEPPSSGLPQTKFIPVSYPPRIRLDLPRKARKEPSVKCRNPPPPPRYVTWRICHPNKKVGIWSRGCSQFAQNPGRSRLVQYHPNHK